MKIFHNLPLLAKVFISPIVGLIGLFAVSVTAYMTINAEKEAITELSDVQFKNFADMTEVEAAFYSVQIQIYNLITVANNQDDPEKVAKLSADVMAAVDKAIELFDRNKLEDTHSPAIAELRSKIKDRLAEYRDSVVQVVDMVQVDVASSTMFMNTTVDDFRLLNEDTEGLKNLVDEERASVTASTRAQAEAAVKIFFAMIGAVVVISLGLSIVISRFIAGPLVRMTDAMGLLAKGDNTIEIPAAGQRDEIGRMAGAVEVFKQNAIESERLQREQERLRAEAEADKERHRQEEEKRRVESEAEKERRRLEAETEKEHRREAEEAEKESQRLEQEKRASYIDELTKEFDRKMSALLEAVFSAATEMHSTAGDMAATAETTSQKTSTVAAATEEAAANVNTVASAAEELSSSVSEITRQVVKSTQITGRAVEEADRTNVTVKGLADAAQRIGQVVELINDIAGQTNLLALNATIEAARAGESGKGFAVVATEVKNLATQTGKATEEIATQINGMQQVTEEAVTAIDGVGRTIGEVSSIATSIASAVEQQGAATQEIARNVQQAASGTQEVSENIGGVSQAAADTGGAAQQVLSAATSLSEKAKELRGEVDEFLSAVKAA